jgi:hypothetical protein
MPFGSTKFSFSRDFDGLPVTKLVVDNGPCMDSGVQVNVAAYATELQLMGTCPKEQNSALTLNPNFKVAGSGWQTSEAEIERENRV